MMRNRVGNVEHKAAARVREHRDKIEMAAKAGWIAKGALYLTLGVLALLAAIGSGGAITGSEGVLQWVAGMPFGTVLLVLAGIGLACYALWRFAQAIVDPEVHKDKKEMIAKRIGWTLSGAMHVALSVAAFQLVAGRSGGSSKQTWLAQILSSGFGAFVIGVLGVVAIAFGLYQFKKAVDLAFLQDMDTHAMSPKERKTLRLVGRLGLAARGVVFPIIGYFLLEAAVESDPSEAAGVGGALGEIAEAGWFLLALVAIGLAAYGVLQLFFAKYRHVRVG